MAFPGALHGLSDGPHRLFTTSQVVRTPCKIIFVTSGATAGGAERQLVYFLRLHDRQRFYCTVLTVLAADSDLRRGGNDFRPELRACGVPVQSVDSSRFPTLRGVLALYRVVIRSRPHLVHTYGLAVDLVTRCLPLGRCARIGSMRNSEDHRPDWLFRLDGLTSRRLNGYVSNSLAGKNALVYRGGVRPDRVCVIPNGIDADAFAQGCDIGQRLRLREEWGATNRDLIVLTVANLHTPKGHEDIIRAIRELDGKVPAHFVFAGEDRSGGNLEEFARSLGVRDRISFLGFRTDVATLLAASDVSDWRCTGKGCPTPLWRQ